MCPSYLQLHALCKIRTPIKTKGITEYNLVFGPNLTSNKILEAVICHKKNKVWNDEYLCNWNRLKYEADVA
jgi:hypothetical protein